jgi:hypothetical protein
MKVYQRGKLIEEYEDHNLIVDGARSVMARLIAGEVEGQSITHIALGTNGATPTPDDTEITEAFPTHPPAGWNLLVSEANGLAIIEFGLLCGDGTLFARKIREKPLPIYKEDDISVDGQWTIIF